MKKTKGISLIVLVITIIVMIIIAGAIILSLSNTNVIDQAEQAKDKYNLSQLKEAVNLDRTNALLTRYNTTEGVNISVKELLGLTDSDAMEITSTNTMPGNMPAGKYYKLDVTKYGMQSAGTVENNTIKGAYVINDNYDIYYVVEGITSEVTSGNPLAIATKDEMLQRTSNTNLLDMYGNKITIPAGFKILVDDTTDYTVANVNVTQGIVVTDGTNEFVWVPVGENITNGTKTATITLGRYSNFVADENGVYTPVAEGTVINSCEESGFASEWVASPKDITKFISNTNQNGGYYIGRYEVSSIDQNGTTKLESKKLADLWINSNENLASRLCQAMYSEKPFSSDLINSYAWDTAIIFIQTFSDEIDYYNQNNCTKLGKTGENNDEVLHINDMSGNAVEISTEIYLEISSTNSLRGGGWAVRMYDTEDELYIDEERCEKTYKRGSGEFGADGCSVTARPILYIE